MSMAIIGTVVAIGGTAYGIYASEQARDAASSAQPRPFVPLNVRNVARQALEADELSYRISDQDFQNRFPDLVRGRNYMADNAASNLRGETSPVVTNAMSKAGLTADLGNNEFQKARNLGKPILSIEQRDRNYFRTNLALNPQRTAGLSGPDVTKLTAQNTGAQNAFNSNVFGNKTLQYNANIAQGIQNQNAAIGGLAGLAGLLQGGSRQQRDPSLDPSYYSRLTQSLNPALSQIGPGY